MKHAMKHNNHKNHFDSPKISKDINANVVVDERLKNRTINGGYVAWPRGGKKETGSEPKTLYKVFNWFKTIRSRYTNSSFAG